MLVGVGGSGKQSCSRLATYLAEYECFQIELTRGYGIDEFHEDLKNLMIKTGRGEKTRSFTQGTKFRSVGCKRRYT